MNNWKDIWENRSVDDSIYTLNNNQEVFAELKKINGFDVIDNGLSYEALFEQFNKICRKVDLGIEKSIFEVGCGSGANLFMFQNRGFKVAGLDYSHTLVETARKILDLNDEIVCDEAINLDVDKKFSTLLSNSVFSYFESLDYAERVLEKMYEKSLSHIVLIDLHDAAKKSDFLDYRRRVIEDYDERYKNLPKLFYPKEFFIKFAKTHNMSIEITESDLKGYWNNPFVFNCYMHKLK